jgi:hypothetical protein
MAPVASRPPIVIMARAPILGNSPLATIAVTMSAPENGR